MISDLASLFFPLAYIVTFADELTVNFIAFTTLPPSKPRPPPPRRTVFLNCLSVSFVIAAFKQFNDFIPIFLFELHSNVKKLLVPYCVYSVKSPLSSSIDAPSITYVSSSALTLTPPPVKVIGIRPTTRSAVITDAITRRTNLCFIMSS